MSRASLLAALASARALVASLEAALEADADALLGVEQTMERYRVGRESLLRAADRGELVVTRGARGKLLVRRSELEAWLASRPVAPRARRARPANDQSEWDAAMEAELRAVGGLR